MRFTLKYQGESLLSSGNAPKPEQKQILRSHFHCQLKKLWDTSNVLQFIDRRALPEPVKVKDKWERGEPRVVSERPLEGFLYRRKIYDSWFVPLITGRMEAACHLSIRLGRPIRPGMIVYEGGDLDGRLKTLFDALAVPKDASAVKQADCQQDEYLCLLSDDELITGVSIESYEILETKAEAYVDVDISVTITATTPMNGTAVLLFG